MKVYIFRVSGGINAGEAIVAAKNADEAWDVLCRELGWEAEFFSKDNCEQVHSLKYLSEEPALITYSLYIE